MKPREYRAEPPLWLLGALVAMMLIVIVGLLVTPVWSSELALGDSLALGFGQASGMPTRAIVGISSCRIARITPSKHYDFVLLSVGTNDPPGRCIETVRARVNAARVEWVVPVNGARGHVLAVAGAHGDATLFYTPGARSWPHPAAYWDVTGRHKPVIHKRKRHARRHP